MLACHDGLHSFRAELVSSPADHLRLPNSFQSPASPGPSRLQLQAVTLGIWMISCVLGIVEIVRFPVFGWRAP